MGLRFYSIFVDQGHELFPRIRVWCNNKELTNIAVWAKVPEAPLITQYGYVRVLRLNESGKPYIRYNNVAMETIYGDTWWDFVDTERARPDKIVEKYYRVTAEYLAFPAFVMLFALVLISITLATLL